MKFLKNMIISIAIWGLGFGALNGMEPATLKEKVKIILKEVNNKTPMIFDGFAKVNPGTNDLNLDITPLGTGLYIHFSPIGLALDIQGNQLKVRLESIYAGEFNSVLIDLKPLLARGGIVEINLTLDGEDLLQSTISTTTKFKEVPSLKQQSIKAVADKVIGKIMTLEQAKKILPTDLH